MLEHDRIYAITCVGSKGEIGLNNALPWQGQPEYKSAMTFDLRWFQTATANGLLISGHNTFRSMHKAIECIPLGRTLLQVDLIDDLEKFVKITKLANPGQYKRIMDNVIWIVGGAKTYTKWAPYTKKVFINTIPYVGEADTFFPFTSFPHLKVEDYCSLNNFTAGKFITESLSHEWDIKQ